MSSAVLYQTSPSKMSNILQQNNTQNVPTLVARKPIVSTLNPKDILLTNPARKKAKPGEKLTQPAPVAVARRNARERNRVKQVNNGFATLRQHIPNFIASAFESSNGRGGSKKLSKVETLRMAVEYIRTLEDMLSEDEQNSYSENSENISASSNSFNSLPNTSPSSSPATNINTNLIYTYPIMSPSNEEDDLKFITTPTHANYSTTIKTYQIPIYDDDDNFDSLDDNILSDPSLMDADIDLNQDLNQDLSLLNSIHTTGSLSPEMYSEDSLSPIAIDRCRTNEQMFIPVFNSTNEDIKLRITPEMIMEIKSEPLDDDTKENIIQVPWWELQQQSRS